MKNFPTLSTPHIKRSQQGFSLVEVLVALLVISFGMLGVAGMQALSVNNTNAADFRSLAALQAASIAAAMSSNEAYWQTTSVTGSVTVVGTTLTSNDLSTTTTVCSSTLCTPTQMAENDLQNWGSTLNRVLPNGFGTINCTKAVSALTSNTPSAATCQIYVYWSEKNYAQNQVAGTSLAGSYKYDFEMMVQP